MPRNYNRGKARAPYNFIPITAQASTQQGEIKPYTPIEAYPSADDLPRHHHFDPDLHSGYFTVRLETKTPLYIRGMLTRAETRANNTQRQQGNDALHQTSAFFSYDGETPVIPGSTLRGMIRSLVEIITFGKIHFVSDNKLVYRAIFYQDALANTYRNITTDVIGSKEYFYPSRLMHGGYLQKGDSESGWVIQPAIRHHGESIVLVDRKQVVDIGIKEKPSLRTYNVGVQPARQRVVHTGKQGVQLHIARTDGIHKQLENGYEPATLLISSTVGKIGGKNSNRTWYPAIYAMDNDAEPIPISQRIWNDFIKDRDINRGIANRRLDREGDVLFYLNNDNDNEELKFFGPTMFFRIPYDNSILDLTFDDFDADECIDYADAMFGYISEDGQKSRDLKAYAGRISVTSAQPIADYDPHNEAITPHILAGPKPTTIQHYVEQPDQATDDESKLKHYGMADATIRGHKLYWRQNIDGVRAVQADAADVKDKDNVTTRIQPLVKGMFAFKVHFSNLTATELGALAWVLSLGEDEEAYHMLGMGKPLGMGVVRLEPQLTLIERGDRYANLFDASGKWVTGERSAEMTTYIDDFKRDVATHTGTDFDAHWRIQQLKAMLRLYQPDKELHSYMTIQPNEYRDKRVLPYPTEVAAMYDEKENERQQQLRQRKHRDEIRSKTQLHVGDEIRGEVFMSNPKTIWFHAVDVVVAGKWEPIDIVIGEGKFQGKIFAVKKNRDKGAIVKARITEIKVGKKLTNLICEQLV
jgi:CRISPR-associated protein (TIGR03986 family)